MRISFSSSLQTCRDAGRSICGTANTEVYRKYTELYNNFQIFQISKTEIFQQDFKQDFKVVVDPLATTKHKGAHTMEFCNFIVIWIL